MSYDIEFANELKNRDNESPIGVIVGKVTKISPLTVSIYDGAASFSELDSEGNILIYKCKNATEYQIPFSLTGYEGTTITGTITHEGLKVGDRVAAIATEDNQKLFIIDKLE